MINKVVREEIQKELANMKVECNPMAYGPADAFLAGRVYALTKVYAILLTQPYNAEVFSYYVKVLRDKWEKQEMWYNGLLTSFKFISRTFWEHLSSEKDREKLLDVLRDEWRKSRARIHPGVADKKDWFSLGMVRAFGHVIELTNSGMELATVANVVEELKKDCEMERSRFKGRLRSVEFVLSVITGAGDD